MARPTGTAYEPCPHSSPLPSAYEQSAKELKVPLHPTGVPVMDVHVSVLTLWGIRRTGSTRFRLPTLLLGRAKLVPDVTVVQNS